jgi:hypothetical protein
MGGRWAEWVKKRIFVKQKSVEFIYLLETLFKYHIQQLFFNANFFNDHLGL